MNDNYETLPAPTGTFQKWEAVGDVVQGRIGSFGLDTGSDFDGNPCPELVVETEAGNVIITAGTANLKKQFTANAARLIAGHGVRVEFSGTYPTKQGTPGKSFTVGVTPKPIAPITVELADDEAPF